MVTQNLGKRRVPSASTGLAIAAGTLVLTALRQHWCAGIAARLRSCARLAEQRRDQDALNHQHRLHFDLLCKAMDDPALAAVLDTYESEVPPKLRRQYLFANALYTNAVHAHRIGALSLSELHGHLRVMCQNAIFRGYWDATRHHRASLPRSSREAELGRMVDDLVHELEEADTDEWWVVGEPPEE